MTLSILDINRKRLNDTGIIYFYVALFCVLFAAIYEYFSHGVYSNYMIYAFAIPLLFGSFVMFGIKKFGCGLSLPTSALYLYHSGIAALTVGSIFTGVLEIYGTTNQLLRVYWVFGGICILFSFLMFLGVNLPKKNEG